MTRARHASLSHVGGSAHSADFTMDELGLAFDRVRDPRDWQGPILAVIPAAEWRLVAEAVMRFTATRPVFWEVAEDRNRLLVTAPGCRFGDDPWGFLGPAPGA